MAVSLTPDGPESPVARMASTADFATPPSQAARPDWVRIAAADGAAAGRGSGGWSLPALRQTLGPATLALGVSLMLSLAAAQGLARWTGDVTRLVKTMPDGATLKDKTVQGMAWLGAGESERLLLVRQGASAVEMTLRGAESAPQLDADSGDTNMLLREVNMPRAGVDNGSNQKDLVAIQQAHASRPEASHGAYLTSNGPELSFLSVVSPVVTADGGFALRGDLLAGLRAGQAAPGDIAGVKELLETRDIPAARRQVVSFLPDPLSKDPGIAGLGRANIIQSQSEITAVAAYAESKHLAIGSVDGTVAIHTLPRVGALPTPVVEGRAGQAAISLIATPRQFGREANLADIAVLDSAGGLHLGIATTPGALAFLAVAPPRRPDGRIAAIRDLQLGGPGGGLSLLTADGAVFVSEWISSLTNWRLRKQRLDDSRLPPRYDDLSTFYSIRWRLIYESSANITRSSNSGFVFEPTLLGRLPKDVQVFADAINQIRNRFAGNISLVSDGSFSTEDLWDLAQQLAADAVLLGDLRVVPVPLPLVEIATGTRECSRRATAIADQAGGALVVGADDGSVQLNWLDVRDGSRSVVRSAVFLPGHREAVARLLFAPDGKKLASVDTAGSVRVSVREAVEQSARRLGFFGPSGCPPDETPPLRVARIDVPPLTTPERVNARPDPSGAQQSTPPNPSQQGQGQAVAQPQVAGPLPPDVPSATIPPATVATGAPNTAPVPGPLRPITVFPQTDIGFERQLFAELVRATGPVQPFVNSDRIAFRVQQVEGMKQGVRRDEIRFCSIDNRGHAEALKDTLNRHFATDIRLVSIIGSPACLRSRQRDTLEVWLTAGTVKGK